METIDVTILQQLLGDYFRQRYPEIVQKYQAAQELRNIFKPITMVKDELVITEADVTEVMQAYQTDWTPKGTLKFLPEILKLRYFKADIPVDPNILRSTYYADVISGAKSEEHKIVRLAYDAWMKRAARDTVRALVNGKYKSTVAGTASAAMDAVDGFREFINKNITLKKIEPTTLGVIDHTTIMDAVNELLKTVPEEIREGGMMVCYMSENNRQNYFKNYRDNWGTLSNYDGWDGKIDSTNIKIVAVPQMGKSNRIVITMEDNIVYLEGVSGELFKIDVQKQNRKFHVMLDWSGGIGAKIVGQANDPSSQYIWCNELDMEAPAKG